MIEDHCDTFGFDYTSLSKNQFFHVYFNGVGNGGLYREKIY